MNLVNLTDIPFFLILRSDACENTPLNSRELQMQVKGVHELTEYARYVGILQSDENTTMIMTLYVKKEIQERYRVI